MTIDQCCLRLRVQSGIVQAHQACNCKFLRALSRASSKHQVSGKDAI